MITKNDLKKAFEQGERYDYRVTKAQCFNRWYNQNYLDAEKCKNCKYSEQKHYKNCLNCIEHSNFTKCMSNVALHRPYQEERTSKNPEASR